VTLPPGADDQGGVTYTIKKNNADTIKGGTLDFSSGSATIGPRWTSRPRSPLGT
jgi:hypothetical protein